MIIKLARRGSGLRLDRELVPVALRDLLDLGDLRGGVRRAFVEDLHPLPQRQVLVAVELDVMEVNPSGLPGLTDRLGPPTTVLSTVTLTVSLGPPILRARSLRGGPLGSREIKLDGGTQQFEHSFEVGEELGTHGGRRCEGQARPSWNTAVVSTR